jgi:hypothetical protein
MGIRRGSRPFAQIENILFEGVDSAIPNGLTMEKVAKEYLERATIMIRTPIKLASEFNKLVVSTDMVTGALRALRGRSSGYWSSEHEKRNQILYREIMERIVADVESLRTEDWLCSPDRQPVLLPSWLELQVSLLPSPKVNPSLEKPDEEFVRRVLELVKRCVEDPALLSDFDYVHQVMKSPKGAEIRS